MSFFSLTPHPSVPPIDFFLSSTLPSFHLPDLVCHSSLLCLCSSDMCLPVCLPVYVFGLFLFIFAACLNLPTQLACTQTHKYIYELLHISLPSPSLSVSLLLSLLHTHTHTQKTMCTSHTHTRHRQMVHLPGKLPSHALIAPTSTLLPWAVRLRTRPPTPPTPQSLLPPITSPQHAATFPAP